MCINVAQGASKLLEVKVGGLKKRYLRRHCKMHDQLKISDIYVVDIYK